jgi:hypothetical protein
MANSSVKLPVVEPFELNNPTSPGFGADGPELEAALMSELRALAATYGRPAAPPAGEAPAAPPSPRPLAESPVPTAEDVAAARLGGRPFPDKPQLEALDPQLVARRLAQLRRPRANPESVPVMAAREAAAADPLPQRVASAAASAARRQAPLRVASPTAAPPEAHAAYAVPGHAAVHGRAPARPTPEARGAALAAHLTAPRPAPAAQADINHAAERALRGWSIGDQMPPRPAHPRPVQRSRYGLTAAVALLLVGVSVGAMIVSQWAAPRDRVAGAPGSATGSIVASAARAAVPPAGSNPAPQVAEARPAPAPAAPTVTAGVQPPAAAAAATARPAGATDAAARQQLRLVQEDPATAAARQRATTNAAAHPSWYVEDDPAYEAPPATVTAEIRPAGVASGGKRMMVTSDVDVRSGPDPASPSLGVLKAGAVIAVGDCNRWCAVTVDDKTGWVFSAFLAEASAVTAAR